jgi:hypothetical protein
MGLLLPSWQVNFIHAKCSHCLLPVPWRPVSTLSLAPEATSTLPAPYTWYPDQVELDGDNRVLVAYECWAGLQ